MERGVGVKYDEAVEAQFDEHTGSLELGVLHPTDETGYVEFELRLDVGDTAYDYSKLYYSTHPDRAYTEDEVVCFRVKGAKRFESVRIVLPDAARATGYLRLRLDGLPYSAGTFRARSLGLVGADIVDELSRRAHLHAQKEWVRKQVVRSETEHRIALLHYPESVSLELTPRCNLTCAHCSSHGTPELHRRNNSLRAFDQKMLERLGHEVFPHLTQLTIVGRGEPTLVEAQTWRLLIDLLKHYDVFLCCVTNGYFIEQRLDEHSIGVMDTLTVSIDGMTPDTFALNRGGADLERVLKGVRYYCELRERAQLARRPRLGFSWTLKKNNIAEFPSFLRSVHQAVRSALPVRAAPAHLSRKGPRRIPRKRPRAGQHVPFRSLCAARWHAHQARLPTPHDGAVAGERGCSGSGEQRRRSARSVDTGSLSARSVDTGSLSARAIGGGAVFERR